ncbi:TIGR03032 family protein [Pirellulales bacterium]|nr:TIGR03032 family protein [Pirellulales bacterium]
MPSPVPPHSSSGEHRLRSGAPEVPWLQVIGSRYLADWMVAESVSLALTTYQLGKLLFLGQKPTGDLTVFERSFDRCMGLYATPDAETLWMSSRSHLWRFENMPSDGPHDRMYVPRGSYVTGDIDIHDLALDNDGQPVFVNTLFNCLATISPRYNFDCLWRPEFISRLAAEDRCHLNGLALCDGRPRYVTLCGRSDVVDGWRDCRRDGGCVIDISTNEVVAQGLSMPHSPRWHLDRLWLVEAGSGWFGYIDADQGKFQRITFCSGYARGLAMFGDWAIVGLSLPRHEPTFQGLPLDDELKRHGAAARCGLIIINHTTGDIAHWLRIENKVHELFEIVELHGALRPAAMGLMNDDIEKNAWFHDGDKVRHWEAAGGKSKTKPPRSQLE